METTQRSLGQYSAPEWLLQANQILEVLHGRIKSENLPVFGSGMLSHPRDRIVASTVGTRVLKKFQRPSSEGKKALRQACFSQWVAYEDELRALRWRANAPTHILSHLYRARALIHEWCEPFKRDTELVEFTPGETLVSAQGRVSVYQKLSRKESWQVTHDAQDDFIRLCYNNLSLKRCAKAHWPKLTRSQTVQLYEKFRNEPHVGYAVFSFMMRTFVITVVHGSRASSVRKNNDEDRFINVEPLGNMILQRQCASPLRAIMASIGNDLELGQQRHRDLISMFGKTTVDFSKASDSVLHEVVNFCFPSKVAKLLTRYRSPMVLIDGVYYCPVKLSSMGCGFTFEVMSMLLLALARVLDPVASVYGDDVIIANDAAAQFIEATGCIGFKVNEKKTFVGSAFRESCGAFYLDGFGYITCFDIHWCECLNDVLIAVNKLYLIVRDNPNIGHCYSEAYEALIRMIPALLLGYPGTDCDPAKGFAFHDQARRKHMRSNDVTVVRKRNQWLLDLLAACYQVKSSDILLCTRPKYVPEVASKSTRDLRNQGAKYCSYMYSGMVAKDVVRNSGKWVTQLSLVHPSFVMDHKAALQFVQSFMGPRGLMWVRTEAQVEYLAGLESA